MMAAWMPVLGAALLAGCDDEPDIKEYVYPEPVVESYSPAEGYAKSHVTILGSGFGARYADHDGNSLQAASVSFGGAEADNILSVNDECIVVEVPEDAVSGKIMLKVWTHEVEVGDFEVWESPTVSGTINAVVNPGESVTREGTRFGTSQEQVQVRFGDTMGTITEWSESKIVAVAPEGYATGALTLIVNGLEISAGAVINSLAKGDVTIAYLKNFKQPFEADATFCEQAGVDGNAVGTWLVPADWTVNDNAKSAITNSVKSGGLQNNTLIMQSGWDLSTFSNGKMYQTVKLPAGRYRLTAVFRQWGIKGNSKMYWLVVKGTDFPDTNNVEANEDVYQYFSPSGEFNAANDTSVSDPKALEFEFAEETEITLGFVASFTTDQSYFRVQEIKLEKL